MAEAAHMVPLPSVGGIRAKVFSFALLGHVFAASAAMPDCAVDGDVPVTRHVVAVQSDDPTSPLRNLRTGILLTDTGIVLTVLNPSLAEPTVNGADLLATDISQLTVKVFSNDLGADDAVTGVVFGNDWRRNLVVIKLAQADVAKLAVEPLALVGFTGGATSDVCIVGFKETEPDTYTALATDGIPRMPGTKILWTMDLRTATSQTGGAVIDPADGSLLGIIVGQRGDTTDYLPIEFADTLLSQVFIARIMRDMDSLMATKEVVQSGVGWTYQILTLPDAVENPEDLQIRFFLQRYSTDLQISAVNVSTQLWGTDENGDTDISVKPPEDYKPAPLQLENQNFIRYSAADMIAFARNQGFKSIERIRVSLIPKFTGPASAAANAANRRTVFELPISIILPEVP